MISGLNLNSGKLKVDLKFFLYLFVACLPLEFFISGTFFTISQTLGLAVFVLFSVRLKAKKFIIHIDRASVIFLLFMAYSLSSTLWSNYSMLSLDRAFTVMQLIVLYIIIINEVNSKESLNKLLVFSTIGGAILSISGLIELNQIGFSSYRIAGISRNANIYFIMSIFLIPSIYWSVTYNKNIFIRLFSITVLLLLFFTSLYTQSRGGLISLGVFTLCYFIIAKNKNNSFIGLLATGILTLLLAPKDFWPRFLNIGNDYSTDRLSILWPAGWEAFKSRFFFGHGIGTSPLILPNYLQQSFDQMSVHNSLLAIGIDLGIVGVILYLAVIAIPTINIIKLCCFKRNASRTYLEDFGVILFCVLLAYLASWFKSGGFEYYKYIWVLVALETCVTKMIRAERKRALIINPLIMSSSALLESKDALSISRP